MTENKPTVDTEDLQYDIKVAVYKLIRKHRNKVPEDELLGCIYRTVKEVISHD